MGDHNFFTELKNLYPFSICDESKLGPKCSLGQNRGKMTAYLPFFRKAETSHSVPFKRGDFFGLLRSKGEGGAQ